MEAFATISSAEIQVLGQGPGRVDEDMEEDMDDCALTMKPLDMYCGDALLLGCPRRQVSELPCRSATSGISRLKDQEMFDRKQKSGADFAKCEQDIRKKSGRFRTSRTKRCFSGRARGAGEGYVLLRYHRSNGWVQLMSLHSVNLPQVKHDCVDESKSVAVD